MIELINGKIKVDSKLQTDDSKLSDKCPECGEPLYASSNEIYCKSCTFDKTLMDLWSKAKDRY